MARSLGIWHVKTWVFLGCAAAAILTGCATTPQRRPCSVSINGLVNRDITNSAVSFAILSADKDISASDLQFQEYASVLERGLNQRGYRKANLEEADMAVFLAYGIGEPKEHVYTYSLPVFGQTGVSSAMTFGTVSSSGYGSATYSGSTYSTPSYGITGYSSHVDTYVTFTRHVHLTAVDLRIFRAEKKMVQLWKTGMISVGANGDLRQVFPVMIAAGMEHFGTDTKQIQRTRLYHDDPRVLLVKGMPADVESEPGKTSDPQKVQFPRGAR